MYVRAYQKFLHVLLCEAGGAEGRGRPLKRAGYGQCVLLEGTGLEDIRGQEIYEGDIVSVNDGLRKAAGLVDGVPDMFRSRGLHPMQDMLVRLGFDPARPLTFEILGNRYEQPGLMENLLR